MLERYRRERGFMNHHAAKVALALLANDFLRKRVVRPGGFELPTFWFVAKRSIQLSYGRSVFATACGD